MTERERERYIHKREIEIHAQERERERYIHKREIEIHAQERERERERERDRYIHERERQRERESKHGLPGSFRSNIILHRFDSRPIASVF